MESHSQVGGGAFRTMSWSSGPPNRIRGRNSDKSSVLVNGLVFAFASILIVVAFLALLPYRRSTKGTWKSKGAFVAFVIALMTEMFGLNTPMESKPSPNATVAAAPYSAARASDEEGLVARS